MQWAQNIGRFFVVLSLGLVACQPKIGDECITNLDCSQQGDRICDTTVDEGYCTQANCDTLSCPEKESICVAFNNTLSTVGACNRTDPVSPYRRNFCMATCDESSDCRDDYACIDLEEDNRWGAAVIRDPKSKDGTKACLLSVSRAEIDEDRADAVCTGEDSSGGGGAGGATL